MAPTTHVLDPKGEVVIILRNETPTNVKRARREPPNKARRRAEATEGTTEHRIQVSAKHLTFVSPVFEKLLTGGLKESATFAEKGSVEVTAGDWQLEAFLIILRAIHCQYHEVPKKVTLHMLADIAVIANHYDCAQVLHIIKEIWVEALEEKVPLGYSTELMRWVWVSWFFNIPSKFEEATSIAMTWSNNVIDSLGFPIPGELIGEMNRIREEKIDDLIQRLHDALANFLRPQHGQGCIFECKSIMYGALSYQMQSLKIPSPKPATPFKALKYGALALRVSSLQSP